MLEGVLTVIIATPTDRAITDDTNDTATRIIPVTGIPDMDDREIDDADNVEMPQFVDNENLNDELNRITVETVEEKEWECIDDLKPSYQK